MQKQSPFTAPVVDSLTIRVVVDSRYEIILPKESHPFVAIEHVGEIPGRIIETFAAEWGLSLHLVSSANGSQAEYLLDFGWTPEVLNRNFDLLGIDPAKLNGLVLSHGHLDHFGGLEGFLLKHRSEMKDEMSLYVGGEDAFAPRWEKIGPLEPDGTTQAVSPWGELDREMLRAHKIAPICCETPNVLDGSFTSGYIERELLRENDQPHFDPKPRSFHRGRTAWQVNYR